VPLVDLGDLPVPMRMLPGLRRCDQVSLHRLASGSALHREKQALLQAGWEPLCVPGFDPTAAQQSARELAGLPDDASEPLALLIEEDLAVLDGSNGTLPWLSVCAPSHWAPEDKIGRHWAQVHAPVADNQALMTAQKALIALCTNGQCWERSVYTLASSPRYEQHPHRTPRIPWPPLQGQALAERCWLRVERQGFFPVRGKPGLAVFSIWLQIERLDRSASTRERATQLHAWLSSMSEAVAHYKGLSPVRPALMAWLSERAG